MRLSFCACASVCQRPRQRERKRGSRSDTHQNQLEKQSNNIVHNFILFFLQLATYNASGTAYEVTVSLTLYMLSARLLLFMER